VPPLPEGFVLENAGGQKLPPLPDGFVLESASGVKLTPVDYNPFEVSTGEDMARAAASGLANGVAGNRLMSMLAAALRGAGGVRS
jgi:hypothetical protein